MLKYSQKEPTCVNSIKNALIYEENQFLSALFYHSFQAEY